MAWGRGDVGNRKLDPSAQNIDGIHGWMDVARRDVDDPFDVFDKIHTSGQRLGVKIGGTLYPAPDLMTPEQLLLWKHKVEYALEDGLDSISLSASMVLGAVTGAIFGLVALLPDVEEKGYLVAAAAALMLALTIGLCGAGFHDVRTVRPQRRQLRKVHAAYLTYAHRQARPESPTVR